MMYLFDETNREKFERFDEENPAVYELFSRFALEAVRSGRKRYSAYQIMGRIRWHIEIETRGDDFKINNNHIPWYARKFVDEYPEHAELFTLRAMSRA